MDVNAVQNWYSSKTPKLPCYIVNITAEHGIWQSDNPLTQALPILAMQLTFSISVTTAVYYILRPLRVPHIVPDIIGGILLGPTALGKIQFFARLFPLRSIFIVETIGYWALSCHMFLIGLEMDMKSIVMTNQEVFIHALIGIVIPFVAGIALFFFMNAGDTFSYQGAFFWAITLGITGYPVVTRVLTNLKIIHTEMGRLAAQSSFITDLITWVLVAVLIPAKLGLLNAFFAIVLNVVFAFFCFYVGKPALSYIIKHTSREDKFNDHYLCSVLAAVSVFASATESLGMTSIVGAFLFGLIMPNRVLAGILVDKFESFISGYFLTLYFAACGIRVDFWAIKRWGRAVIVVIFSFVLKILSAFLFPYFYKILDTECFALGVISNTKGILAIFVLNLGYDRMYMSRQDYATMVIAVLLMTGATPSIIRTIYCPDKRLSQYKRRTIQNLRTDAEFRILACFQDFKNVSGMINLLECSNPTRQSPLHVFALSLVELTGRASAMLIVHDQHNRQTRYSENIVIALQTYADMHDLVNIQSLTALSPFSTMHEDICSLAEDKHVAFVIIPFHKLPNEDRSLEEDGVASFRGVNLNVLANTPCTVGIFIDRGFGAVMDGKSDQTTRQVLMVFIGGPDDREALSYAWRMAGSRCVRLQVLRFVPGNEIEETDAQELPLPANDPNRLLTTTSYVDEQQRLDDAFVSEFRLKCASEINISYVEKVANSDEDIVSTLQEMDPKSGFEPDLYVVGKGGGIISPLTKGLLDWSEFPELGAIGDLLAMSTFARGSVLVVQLYPGSGVTHGMSMQQSVHNQGFSMPRVHLKDWNDEEVKDGGGGSKRMADSTRNKQHTGSWRSMSGLSNGGMATASRGGSGKSSKERFQSWDETMTEEEYGSVADEPFAPRKKLEDFEP
ncbi:hypothetical protein K2173_006568 [Erythroxylum novogranatense]|uniref:Cation/H+ exchanger domain-containing protein n=1 Tax=Erythroxylum novogranatense TaxID=1862640 RepID=A0AAV8T598_9ROSI|nr:hypothetical protein K2173_006568 [Erythroxylum novogranatense]